MPRSQLPTIFPYFGICVGADIAQGYPNLLTPNALTDAEKAVFLADADYHIACGINYVRIAAMDWKYVGGSSAGSYGQLRHAFLKELALRYLAGGVNVQYMVADSDWTLAGTQSNNAYKAFLTTEAVWAESVGITRIQLENELEIHLPSGATKNDAYDWQQELAQIVIDAGFTGTKTTSVCQDNFESWTAQGKGLFDEIGLDTYKTTATFKDYIKSFKTTFGDAAYLSEWGSTNVNYFDISSKAYNAEIMAKFAAIKEIFPTIPCYYFTWKYWGGEGDDARGACTEYGDIRYFWHNLINQRNPLYS